MKVLITFQGYGGVQKHRLHDPFQHLDQFDDVTVQHTPSLDNLNEEGLKVLEEFDVVVFNRNISPIMRPEQVFADLRKAGVKIVMDIDDHWELPKDHVAREYYDYTQTGRAMVDQMRHADMVCATHTRLGKVVGEYNSNWAVVPNAIDPVMFPEEDNELTDVPFWQGSITHRGDLSLIKNLPITVCGYVEDDPEWEKIRAMMPNAQFEGARKTGEYYKLYLDKGISVIPLKHTKFNRMKSELKMLESGYYKKPVIVTKIHPYTILAEDGVNCMTVRKNEYASKLKKLQNSPQMQEDLRMKLHEDVMEKYHMDIVNQTRYELLKEVING